MIAAAVVDRPLAEHLDEAGVAVDLDVARLHAIGHVVQLVVGDEACAHRQLHVVVARQGVLPEISDAPDVGEADDGLPGPGIHDLPVDDIERVGRGLGDRAGQRQDVLLEHAAGAQRRLAADGRAARGPCAAAIGRDRAVAAGNADQVDRYADAVGDDLRDARQRALTLVGEAGDAADRARRLKPQRAAVLGRDRRAGGAVIGRPIGGLLAERRDADAAIDTALAQLALLLAQRVVVDQSPRAFPGIRGTRRSRASVRPASRRAARTSADRCGA